MQIKTATLTGPALDWAVAKADNNLAPRGDIRLLDGRVFGIEPGDHETRDSWWKYSPSADWAQGGPIIEREGINIYQMANGMWQASLDYGIVEEEIAQGPTPLIAAMRCYVGSKLGDTVDIPDELIP